MKPGGFVEMSGLLFWTAFAVIFIALIIWLVRATLYAVRDPVLNENLSEAFGDWPRVDPSARAYAGFPILRCVACHDWTPHDLDNRCWHCDTYNGGEA